ncbi:MAG: response regulator [Chitinophagaceae bacterium]|nr:response regulator [Oligoflexus sp.]
MESHEVKTGKCILVCSSLYKDSELTVGILREANLDAESCTDILDLCQKIEVGAAAVLIAIEMLSAEADRLKAVLDRQPAWSDIPFIVLTSSIQAGNMMPQLHILLRNVTVLERPIRILTLVSSLQAAVAARRRQYQVRDLLADVERSRFEAEAANRAKSAFLANMSHEIRTPLGIILGFSELIAAEIPVSDDIRLYLKTIKRNGEDLSKLIDELLDLSKIEAGKLDIEIIPTSVTDLLAEIWNSFADQARRNNVKLTIDVEEDIPLSIQTDPTRLRQILKNLIGNAIKFTRGGSVEVNVGLNENLTSLVPQLQIAVKDTGRGISPHEQKRLFEAFNQADMSTTRNYGGTGLGLFLSRRLARALGGDIVLESSAIGVGSTFVITIDTAGAAINTSDGKRLEERAVEAVRQDAPKAGDELSGMNILVAEDAPDNQLLIRRILTRRGAKVRIAQNGEEAIKAAMANSYDIILMDVQMPLLDGYGATTELRRLGYKGSIIALSAHAMKDERAKSIAMGCDEHLTKPVDVKKLVGIIRDYAGQKPLSQFH